MARAWPALDIHVPACDPQLQELVIAELDDFQPTALQESDETSRLRAFFTASETRDAAARALAVAFGTHVFVEFIDIEDDDWAARSQSELRAVTIGRVTVAPPWDTQRGRESFSAEPHEKDSRPLFVIIRPSMGFGTGHHATTRLALMALQSLDLQGRSVLDIGCGSGVLAIAAAKLGAAGAVGIDIDPDALANAVDNRELNDATKARFEQRDFRQTPAPAAADVVLANLTGGVLQAFASTLAGLVTPGGHLIVSGFMETETEVLPTLQRFLTLEHTDQEDEWMGAVFRNVGT